MSVARREPWEQQQGESAPAYAAFLVYRDLGRRRSLTAASKAVGKAPSLLKGWSSRHAWMVRTEAWDRSQDAEWERERRDADREQRRKALATADRLGGVVASAVERLAADPSKVPVTEVSKLTTAHLRLLESALGSSGARGSTTATAGDEAAFEDLADEERRDRMRAIYAELGSRLAESDDAMDHTTTGEKP